ncbi:MAG: hypothetical protein ACK56J_17205, partial [Planctomycetota bacterium]
MSGEGSSNCPSLGEETEALLGSLASEKSQGGFFHGSLNTKLLISRHEQFSAGGAGFSFGNWPT